MPKTAGSSQNFCLYGLIDTLEEDDTPFDDADFDLASADVKSILQGASIEGNDTSFLFGF
jgi:hypothetical protein